MSFEQRVRFFCVALAHETSKANLDLGLILAASVQCQVYNN